MKFYIFLQPQTNKNSRECFCTLAKVRINQTKIKKMENFVTTKEAIDLLKCSRTTLLKYAKEKKLQKYRSTIKRMTFYDRKEIEQLKEELNKIKAVEEN